jgi:hypothetical protein
MLLNNGEKSGFLEGLQGHVKSHIAQLYESQASHLLNEQASERLLYNVPVGISSRGFGKRAKTAINYQRPNRVHVEKETFFSKIKSFFIRIYNKIFKKKSESNFENIAFPIVQRVFAGTMALDLVPVQPMSAPTGILFYMDEYEAENVYHRIVIVDKYKKYTKYTPMDRTEDYFIPHR